MTDPPYADLEKHRSRGTTTRLVNQWFDVLLNEQIEEVLTECHRVLKPGRHILVFANGDAHYWMRDAIIRSGFTWRKELVWHKLGRLGMGYPYRDMHEFAMLGFKGQRIRQGRSRSVTTVFPYKKVMTRKAYPTEKPVDLAVELIRQSALDGEVVLDPFCGSGAFGVAALDCGMHFLGCDTSERAMQTTCDRLTECQSDLQSSDLT